VHAKAASLVAREARRTLDAAGVAEYGDVFEELELLDVLALMDTCGGGLAYAPCTLQHKTSAKVLVIRMKRTACYGQLPAESKADSRLLRAINQFASYAVTQASHSRSMRLEAVGATQKRAVQFRVAGGTAPDDEAVEEGYERRRSDGAPTRLTPLQAREAVTPCVESQIRILPAPNETPCDLDIRTMYEALTAARPRLPALRDLELAADNRTRPYSKVQSGARREYHHKRAISRNAELDLLDDYLLAMMWGGAVRASDHFNLAEVDHATNVRLDDDEEPTPLACLYTVVQEGRLGLRREALSADLTAQETAVFVDTVLQELDRHMYSGRKTPTQAVGLVKLARLSSSCTGQRFVGDDGYSTDGPDRDDRDDRDGAPRRSRPRGGAASRPPARDRGGYRSGDRRGDRGDRGDRDRGDRDRGTDRGGGGARDRENRNLCYDWADGQVDSRADGCRRGRDCKFRHSWRSGERLTYTDDYDHGSRGGRADRGGGDRGDRGGQDRGGGGGRDRGRSRSRSRGRR